MCIGTHLNSSSTSRPPEGLKLSKYAFWISASACRNISSYGSKASARKAVGCIWFGKSLPLVSSGIPYCGPKSGNSAPPYSACESILLFEPELWKSLVKPDVMSPYADSISPPHSSNAGGGAPGKSLVAPVALRSMCECLCVVLF